MIVRASRVMFGAAGALVALLALLFGVAAWRLSQGPISLNFLTPYLSRAMVYSELGVRIEIDDTILSWAGIGRPMEIRILGARVRNDDGQVLLSTPEAAVTLSPRLLFEGIIAPKDIELRGLGLILTRSIDGRLDFGFGRPAEEEAPAAEPAEPTPVESTSTDFVTNLMQQLSERGRTGALSDLERVRVTNATITFFDKPSDTQWHAEQGNLTIERESGGVGVELDSVVDLGSNSARISANANISPSQRTITLNVGFSDIEPTILAARVTALSGLSGVHIPLDGRVTLIVGEDRRISDISFTLDGKQGVVDLPGVFDQIVKVKQVMARGSVVDGLTGLVIDKFRVNVTDGPTIEVMGSAQRDGADISVEATGKINDLSIEQLKRLWPMDAAKSGRDWVVDNLSGGKVNEARLKLKLLPTEIRTGQLRDDAFVLDFDYQGITVDYLRPMSRALDARGTARFNAESLRMAIASAHVGDLALTNATVNLTGLNKPDQFADIGLEVSGPIVDALKLLDEQPLRLTGKLGLKPAAIGGTAATKVKLKFPLTHTLRPTQVDVTANAQLQDVAMADVIRDVDLSQGQLTLAVNRESLDLSGDVKLRGLPAKVAWQQYFDDRRPVEATYGVVATVDQGTIKDLGVNVDDHLDGPIGVNLKAEFLRNGDKRLDVKADLTQAHLVSDEINWSKAKGVAGQASARVQIPRTGPIAINDLDLRAGDLSGALAMVIDNGHVNEVTIRSLRWTGFDLGGKVTRQTDDGYKIDLQGARADLRSFIKENVNQKSPVNAPVAPTGPEPPLQFSGRFDQVQLDDQTELKSVVLTFDRRNQVVMQLNLDANYADGRKLTGSVVPDGDGRKLTLVSEDTGPLLGYVDLQAVTGGTMRADGRFLANEPKAPLEVRVRIDKFRVVKASMLTQILTLGSLTGIADTLAGEGIAFERADIPLKIDDKGITMTGAVAVGSALGLRFDGTVNFASESIAMNGTVAPAYTINSMLGSIPLIGQLLVGREGEGLVAIGFNVNGKLSDPKVSVHPLTLLTPGILRQIFGPADGNPGDTSPEQKNNADVR